MSRKQFKPLEWLKAIQENCTDRASADFTFDDDPQRLAERWREMSAKVAAVYGELAELQRQSTDRAYGRIYGDVGADGVRRYKTFDRDGNDVVVTIPT